jgi:hypothetical protein
MSGWTPQTILLASGAAAAALGLLLVVIQFLFEMKNRRLGEQMRSGAIDRSGRLSLQTSYIGVLVFLVGAGLVIIASLLPG